MITQFKNLFRKFLGDDGPVISMITSVQVIIWNYNKSSAENTDDESVVSLSDRIIQYCSPVSGRNLIKFKKSLKALVHKYLV